MAFESNVLLENMGPLGESALAELGLLSGVLSLLNCVCLSVCVLSVLRGRVAERDDEKHYLGKC